MPYLRLVRWERRFRVTAEDMHLLKPRSTLRDPDLVERVKAVAAPATVGLGGERSFGDA